MPPINFWKHWIKAERIIFWFLIALILSALVFFWQGKLMYPAPAITFEHYQQLQKIEVPSHTFAVGLTQLSVPADNYLIFENVFGSALQPNVPAFYFFLAALTASFLIFISLFSSLSRFRFLIGIGLIILFFASLRADALQVFGLGSKTITTLLSILFGGLAYYFHAIKKETTFVKRLGWFSLLTLSFFVSFFFFSKTNAPFLHLAVNGLIAGIMLFLVFLFTVAHEIVASFVTITTQSLKSTKSLQHFLILTSIYLINLFLMFASKMGFIDWGFFSISSFFVFTMSAALGLWGIRQRSTVHEALLFEEPQRIFFFLSLMITAIGTMGFFAATASDMMMDAFDDLIMAAHIGCGLIFALYVIANFAPMLVKNLPVHKVLYKPDTMPHFTFRIMAVIATFALLSWAVPWKTYLNQSIASYYHAYGDLYLSQHDDGTAEALYTKSVQFRNQNLHAHYALAGIYAARYDSFKEKKELEKVNEWTPSVHGYLNLGGTYARQGNLLEAALVWDEGKKKFPESGELKNAAALSFMKLKAIDSALYFFRQAKEEKATKRIAEANLLGARALFLVADPSDSLLSINEQQSEGAKVNALALANLKQQKIQWALKFSADTALSVYQATLWCNYLINQKQNADSSLLNRAIKLARLPNNENFKEQLLITSAHAQYARGEVKSALQTVREIAYASGSANYFSLLGLWLLEQNNPLAASGYFKMANEKYQPLALYYQAIAETEADSLDQAFVSWDSLNRSTNKETAAFATTMKKVLLSKNSEVNNLSDQEKYYFCRYKIALTDSLQFEKTLNVIADEKLKARAMVDRSKKWFALDEIEKSSRQLQRVSGSVDKNLKTEIDQLSLMLAAEKGDWNFVGKKLNGGVEIPFNQRVYLEALQAEQSGNTKEAAVRYTYLVNANNQFEEGIVAASRFVANDTTDRLKNFSLLVDGLLAKPHSVKILKQHILESAALGFPQAAQESLDKLRLLMLLSSFKKFIAAHPDYFGVEGK